MLVNTNVFFTFTIVAFLIEYITAETIECGYLTCQSPEQYCHKLLRRCASCKDFCDMQGEEYCKIRCPVFYDITYGEGRTTTVKATTEDVIQEREHIKKPVIPGLYKEDVVDGLQHVEEKDYSDGVVAEVRDDGGAGVEGLSTAVIVAAAVAALIVIATLAILFATLVYKTTISRFEAQAIEHSSDGTTSPMLSPDPTNDHRSGIEDPEGVSLDTIAQRVIYRQRTTKSDSNLTGTNRPFYSLDLTVNDYVPESITSTSSSSPHIRGDVPVQNMYAQRDFGRETVEIQSSPQIGGDVLVYNNNRQQQQHLLELVARPSSSQIGPDVLVHNNGRRQQDYGGISVVSSSPPQMGAGVPVHNSDRQYWIGASVPVHNSYRQPQAPARVSTSLDSDVTIHTLHHPTDEEQTMAKDTYQTM